MPRECTTHHHACICREERFERMEMALKRIAKPPSTTNDLTIELARTIAVVALSDHPLKSESGE